MDNYGYFSKKLGARAIEAQSLNREVKPFIINLHIQRACPSRPCTPPVLNLSIIDCFITLCDFGKGSTHKHTHVRMMQLLI